MKKRILMVSESSVLSSGYGVYTKELLTRLNKIEDFEVAELACFIEQDDPRLKDIPWRVYANKPSELDHQIFNLYKSDKSNEFGSFTFNQVCLDFKPTHVIDIRDFWMFSYQAYSPFRDYYNWLIMPTVDAYPQNKEWIDYFKRADLVLNYSEFGRIVLEKQCPSLKFGEIASPAASDSFKKMDKSKIRRKFNIDENCMIIGTVMRNQRRKLFPDLLKLFSQLLSEIDRDDVYLYCHTGFPDLGWSFPELILEHGLSDKILFTYKCENCKNIETSFFHDAVKQCRRCKYISSKISCTSYPVTEDELAEIYNMFDIYVQYANSEGFGMPVVEAAKCGLPIVATYYSAMQSTIDNLEQFGVEPIHLLKEAETGCNRAIPNNEETLNILKLMLSTNGRIIIDDAGAKSLELANSVYNWDKTALVWENAIRETSKNNRRWDDNKRIFNPSPMLDIHGPLNQANFLVCEVLGRPDWIGTFIWQRLINDLTYKSRIGNMHNGFYFNENHENDQLNRVPFSFKDAYDECIAIRDYYNMWESMK